MITFSAYFTTSCEQSRFGIDYFGGYERGLGGRPGYADEKSYGRFAHRSAEAYQNGISGMLIVFINPTLFSPKKRSLLCHKSDISLVALIAVFLF